ncbi:MAG: hypothetical protein J5903_03340 [Clostridia bacterium]|nr:hypothetical protein [Clostridia bacterium]
MKLNAGIKDYFKKVFEKMEEEARANATEARAKEKDEVSPDATEKQSAKDNETRVSAPKVTAEEPTDDGQREKESERPVFSDADGKKEVAVGKSDYKEKVVPELEEMTYDELTDDEIERIARESLEEYRNSRAKKLQSDAAEKTENLEKTKKTLSDRADEFAAKIAADAENAKTNVENQALKRGLGRSSIVMGQLSEADRAAMEAKERNYTAAQTQLAEIDESIAALQNDLTDALDALDVETAIKVNDKIKSLKDEREQKRNEVIKYNNEIRLKAASAINSTVSDKKTDANDGEDAEDFDLDKVNKLYEYYYSLGDAAKETIEKDEEFIKKYVGEKGYKFLANNI